MTSRQSYNYIQELTTGDQFDVQIRKNKCKISRKGKICSFDLDDKEESVFFFSMEGVCEIEVIYPYIKG